MGSSTGNSSEIHRTKLEFSRKTCLISREQVKWSTPSNWLWGGITWYSTIIYYLFFFIFLFVLLHRRTLGKEQQPNFLHLLYHPMIKTKLLISFRGNKSIRWTHIFSQSNHHTISSWLYISVTYPLYQYPHGNCHILCVNLESSPDNQPSANHNLSDYITIFWRLQ